eukprot:scaffold1019_cov255-Pinguiococcus_pyrenoidosus.AAC.11
MIAAAKELDCLREGEMGLGQLEAVARLLPPHAPLRLQLLLHRGEELPGPLGHADIALVRAFLGRHWRRSFRGRRLVHGKSSLRMEDISILRHDSRRSIHRVVVEQSQSTGTQRRSAQPPEGERGASVRTEMKRVFRI